MNIGLSSKSVSLIDMSVQARWNIAPRLAGVPGVANVSIWGQRERQVQVLVDARNLRRKVSVWSRSSRRRVRRCGPRLSPT